MHVTGYYPVDGWELTHNRSVASSRCRLRSPCHPGLASARCGVQDAPEVECLGSAPTLVVCCLGCGHRPRRPARCRAVASRCLTHETPVGSSTCPPPTSPVLTSQPVVTATGPPGSPGITKTAATAAQVDAIAVTPGSVWVAAGGLVLRVDPVTGRRVVVPDIETGQPPVVQVTVGAGAVWATTTAGRQLLRIDPRTAWVTASLSVPAQGVAADAGEVWVVCCWAGAHPGGSSPVSIPPVAGS